MQGYCEPSEEDVWDEVGGVLLGDVWGGGGGSGYGCGRRTRVSGRGLRGNAERLLRWKRKLCGFCVCERWRAKRKEVGGLRGREMDSKRKNEAVPSVGVDQVVCRDGSCLKASDMLATPHPAPQCVRAEEALHTA